MMQYLFAVPVIPAPVTMNEHPDFLWYIGILLLAGLIFFVGRTLCKIDKNQSDLFERMRDTENDLAYLKGEHNTMCSSLLPVLKSIDEKLK